MMRSDRRQMLVAILAAGLGLMAIASGASAAPKKEPAQKPQSFIVVQVDEEFQVVEAPLYNQFVKEQQTRFKEATEAWRQRQKEAKLEKAKFDEPQPKAPKVKKLPGTYKDEELAQKAVEKAKADFEKQKEKKEKSAK